MAKENKSRIVSIRFTETDLKKIDQLSVLLTNNYGIQFNRTKTLEFVINNFKKLSECK